MTTWIKVAEAISHRSKCSRAGIGAVIVGPDQRIVSTGYNGPPAGYAQASTRCDEFCPRACLSEVGNTYENCVSVHAEMNAIAYADRTRMEGGCIYVTGSICWDCAKVIANSGITSVVYAIDRDRNNNKIETFLIESGLSVCLYPSFT